MLIVCPACASEYEIATDRVGANGRSVRCAACRETWFIAPEPAAAAAGPDAAIDGSLGDGAAAEAQEADAAADIPVAEPDDPATILDQPAPYPRRAKAKAEKTRLKTRPALSPALAAGLVLFAIVPLALLGRGTVVRAMPQTAGLFAGIGLPVNLRGVSFRDVVAFQAPAEGGKPAELVVEGDLIGVARARTDVPEIAIEVRDARDQTLYTWTVPSPRAALETDETARFRASLSAPPAQGRTVQVRFAEAGKAEVKHTEAAAAEPAPIEAPAASPADAAPHGADAHHAPAHEH